MVFMLGSKKLINLLYFEYKNRLEIVFYCLAQRKVNPFIRLTTVNDNLPFVNQQLIKKRLLKSVIHFQKLSFIIHLSSLEYVPLIGGSTLFQ